MYFILNVLHAIRSIGVIGYYSVIPFARLENYQIMISRFVLIKANLKRSSAFNNYLHGT